MSNHLVGSGEVAAILGVTRQRVAQLAVDEPTFPQPEAVLSSGRIWTREAIQRWKAETRGGQPTRLRRTEREVALDVGKTVSLAGHVARRLHNSDIRVEHLWLILPALEGPAALIFETHRVPITRIEDQLMELYAQKEWAEPEFLPVNPRVDHLIVGASFYAAELRDVRADSRHLLLSLLDDWGSDPVSQRLATMGFSAEGLREAALAVDEVSGPG